MKRGGRGISNPALKAQKAMEKESHVTALRPEEKVFLKDLENELDENLKELGDPSSPPQVDALLEIKRELT